MGSIPSQEGKFLLDILSNYECFSVPGAIGNSKQYKASNCEYMTSDAEMYG